MTLKITEELCFMTMKNDTKIKEELTWVWSCMLFQHFDLDLTHQVFFLYIYFAEPSCERE